MCRSGMLLRARVTWVLSFSQFREYGRGMAPDFRSDRSDSAEGKGRARAAWDAYARTVNKVTLPVLEPVLRPVARRVAATQVADLMGFWIMWHLHGGFEGLVEFGMHPSTVWRKVNKFRTAFKVHPDEFELPGVGINVGEYWDDARRRTLAKHGELPERLNRKPTAAPADPED